MDCLEGAWEGDAVMPGRSWLEATVRRRVRERMKGKFEESCMLIILIRYWRWKLRFGVIRLWLMPVRRAQLSFVGLIDNF